MSAVARTMAQALIASQQAVETVARDERRSRKEAKALASAMETFTAEDRRPSLLSAMLAAASSLAPVLGDEPRTETDATAEDVEEEREPEVDGDETERRRFGARQIVGLAGHAETLDAELATARDERFAKAQEGLDGAADTLGEIASSTGDLVEAQRAATQAVLENRSLGQTPA